MDGAIIFAARYLIVIAPLMLLQVLWMLPARDRTRFAIHVFLALALAYVFAKIGSHIYENPRPFVVGEFVPLVPHGVDNGFPSMHTLIASTIAFLVYARKRMLGIALILVALVVGVARVQAGVHHGIDVVGGFLIALAAVGVAHILLSIRIRR